METWKNAALGIVGLIILYYTFNKKRSATVQVVVVVALLGAGYYFWFREETKDTRLAEETYKSHYMGGGKSGFVGAL